MIVRWLEIDDAESFAKRVLAAEAPEIPAELLDGRRWQQLNVRLSTLSVDESMVAGHDVSTVHCRRRDGFCTAIRDGVRLPPLIAIGSERHLVDGYARLRALRSLMVDEASVVVQWRP